MYPPPLCMFRVGTSCLVTSRHSLIFISYFLFYSYYYITQSMKMIYACGKCNFNVNSKCCDNCDKWYHLECTSLSNKIFIQLSKSDAKWYCTICNTCKQCKKQIIGESICCDSCKNWYDIKCTKIKKNI